MIKLQLKNMFRDKIIIISVCLPLVLAIIIKFYTPESLLVDPKIAILENNLSNVMVKKLRNYADVELFKSVNELENKVKVTSDETIGIIYDEKTNIYSYILQGNETNRTKEIASSLVAFNANGYSTIGNIKILKCSSEGLNSKDLISAIVILIAFYMGSTFVTFTIVSEKEQGLNQVFKISPISKSKFALIKIILGFSLTCIVSFIVALFLVDTSNISLLFLFITVSSLSTVSLGLFIGSLSKDLITAIVNTKVVLLAFIFLPFIAIIMPDNLQKVKILFNILPSYPIFKGLLSFNNITTTSILTCIATIAIHIIISYYLYTKKLYNKYY
ncbi:ABC transporter permease [Clostridium sp. 'deep sea']|uniref:ABC transporter permease n=1 Tax=Clostridium sp. 'deep sea' TaxID=2779445 RepID=UPI0018968B1E|nr:ABC transporter permease [Clostridium sp. 'deep sea']QOR34718.1 ABC transporter permease [Clostridium sp. 'deep sea']